MDQLRALPGCVGGEVEGGGGGGSKHSPEPNAWNTYPTLFVFPQASEASLGQGRGSSPHPPWLQNSATGLLACSPAPLGRSSLLEQPSQRRPVAGEGRELG